MKRLFHTLVLFCVLFVGCSSSEDMPGPASPVIPGPGDPEPPDPGTPATIKYLALGDSYTIGQSVCETCRFPEQLKSSLQSELPSTQIELRIIATTGWTTTQLLSAIENQDPPDDQDLVTLLIGVNNQYQHKPFSTYQTEFPQLVDKAILLANNDKDRVIVVSIPDYAYTPFGQGTPDPATISAELAQYNDFAQSYCLSHGIEFVNITDITQMGIENPELVATDGLHPSAAAYTQFVSRLLPKALAAIGQ